MDSLLEKINQPIYIQDIIVISPYEPDADHLMGECNDIGADEDSQLHRLYLLIEKLTLKAAKRHREANYVQANHSHLADNRPYKNTLFKEGYQNNITRLTTNEFMFYTKKRIEPEEFSALFNEILILAKKQPENLHLILSSFAVSALNDKTMNVTVLVVCGENPKVHFMVKNNDSHLDPMYYKMKKNQFERKEFNNIDISTDSEENFPTLIIQKKEYFFSYNNTFVLTTLGGAKKFEVIEICLDNMEGVGKENLNEYINSAFRESQYIVPLQISQVVTSNTIELTKENILENNITHVDPFYSQKNLGQQNRIVSKKTINSDPFFGTTDSRVFVTRSIKCSLLPFEFFPEVDKHNKNFIEATKRKREEPSLSPNKKPRT